MVMLRPFRALRYDPAAVGDLSAVVAPPYDVISTAQRDALYARSDYNVVRLILNRSPDPYADSAAQLRRWCQDGVLVRDAAPALWYDVEKFTLPGGGEREREGIIGIVHLEPFQSGHICPHERTFARAKEDRLRVLRACRTNLSPIFGLFADRRDALDAARIATAGRTPDVAVHDDAGVQHRVWRLPEVAVTETIAAMLAGETVVIADGHHRYETALAYSEERRARGSTNADAPHNFVLMYLTSMTHPGVVILPTHRVLAPLAGFNAADLHARLRAHFRVTPFARTARRQFLAALREAPQQGRFGIAVAGSDELLVAELTDAAMAERQASHVACQVRGLDVTILDTVILRGWLGLDGTAAAQHGQLTYTHDDDSALNAIERDAQVAFLMNAPRIEDVQAVCLAGETMPEKSTYFYPKLLTGLVFHPLEDEAPQRPAQ
jgi:uncharacterized protein (DUF1015 family)